MLRTRPTVCVAVGATADVGVVFHLTELSSQGERTLKTPWVRAVGAGVEPWYSASTAEVMVENCGMDERLNCTRPRSLPFGTVDACISMRSLNVFLKPWFGVACRTYASWLEVWSTTVVTALVDPAAASTNHTASRQ